MLERDAELLIRAATMRGDERCQFLDHACSGDPDLRARLDAAFVASDRAATTAQTAFLVAAAPSAPGSRETTLRVNDREGAGTVIGPYKLLQEIGEGGFGVVYMAQQASPVKRKVALKVVKPGMDTRQVIARFEAERQALAMMDHPNIAKVFDAGQTVAGRPYFVMELVKGVPMTEYCDTSNLTTRERLDLFIPVCHAVQHAHTKGVIHRDLKPSNILVTLHDGSPVAKVIDFGIAKATSADLTDKTVFTAFRQFIGTPEYMSPEQAAMSGLDVDTRSDIYSLGVILYELLTGSTPIEPGRLRSVGLEELQRILREDDPPRPSTRMTWNTGAKTVVPAEVRAKSGPTTQAKLDNIARHRRTDVRSLRRILRGDLDWIVMKALEKDRVRRYETSVALAEDLQRHIRSEPVRARPPSMAYRCRKFARRNRGMLVASGGVLAAVMLTIAALVHGYLKVREERDRTAERETVTRAEMLLASMNAVRNYTAKSVRPRFESMGPAPGGFIHETVPGFSARKVYEDFRLDKKYKDFVYKEATLDPTNRDNLADDFEKGLVSAFRDDRTRTETSGIREIDGRRHYYIARPMVVNSPKCLDCHGDPAAAPAGMVQAYPGNGGFNWEMNQIVSAQTVYVPVAEAFMREAGETQVILLSLAGVFVIGGILAVGVLGRA